MSDDIKTGDTVEFSLPSYPWRVGVVEDVSEDGTEITVVRGMSRHRVTADQVQKLPPCDECFVNPDGTRHDGQMCACRFRRSAGCRCQPSPAEYLGPAYVRAEIAGEED